MKVIKGTFKDVYLMSDQAEIDGADISEGARPINWLLLKDELDDTHGCIGLLVIGKRGRVRGWYVDSQYRGTGCGKMLLIALLELAKELGLEEVEMNTRHYKMVENWGWVDTGIKYTMQPFFFGDARKMKIKI